MTDTNERAFVSPPVAPAEPPKDEEVCASCGHSDSHRGGCYVCRSMGERCRRFAAPLQETTTPAPSEKLAKQFHDAYERLAPSFGYETRRDSAVPWAEVPENNRRLMVAVCAEVLATQARTLDALREAAKPLQAIYEIHHPRCMSFRRDLLDVRHQCNCDGPTRLAALRAALTTEPTP